MLLQHGTTAAQYPATGTDRYLTVIGRWAGFQPARLLQQRVDWATCQPDPASPVVQNAAARLNFGIPVQNKSRTRSPVFIGFASQSASSSKSPY